MVSVNRVVCVINNVALYQGIIVIYFNKSPSFRSLIYLYNFIIYLYSFYCSKLLNSNVEYIKFNRSHGNSKSVDIEGKI